MAPWWRSPRLYEVPYQRQVNFSLTGAAATCFFQKDPIFFHIDWTMHVILKS